MGLNRQNISERRWPFDNPEKLLDSSPGASGKEASERERERAMPLAQVGAGGVPVKLSQERLPSIKFCIISKTDTKKI